MYAVEKTINDHHMTIVIVENNKDVIQKLIWVCATCDPTEKSLVVYDCIDTVPTIAMQNAMDNSESHAK